MLAALRIWLQQLSYSKVAEKLLAALPRKLSLANPASPVGIPEFPNMCAKAVERPNFGPNSATTDRCPYLAHIGQLFGQIRPTSNDMR